MNETAFRTLVKVNPRVWVSGKPCWPLFIVLLPTWHYHPCKLYQVSNKFAEQHQLQAYTKRNRPKQSCFPNLWSFEHPHHIPKNFYFQKSNTIYKCWLKIITEGLDRGTQKCHCKTVKHCTVQWTSTGCYKVIPKIYVFLRQHWVTSYLSDTVMVPGTELHLLLWLNWLGHITPRHNHVGQQWQKVGQGGNHLSKATPECFVLLVEIEYHRNGYDECSYVICSNYLHNL